MGSKALGRQTDKGVKIAQDERKLNLVIAVLLQYEDCSLSEKFRRDIAEATS